MGSLPFLLPHCSLIVTGGGPPSEDSNLLASGNMHSKINSKKVCMEKLLTNNTHTDAAQLLHYAHYYFCTKSTKCIYVM